MIRTAIVLFSCCGFSACDLSRTAALDNKQVYNGDPARGRAIVESGVYGCASCHTIPGIRAPRGVVGPTLDGMPQRSFIAGQLPNRPDVLVAFLQDPPSLVPQTGMPKVGVSVEESRDIASFLYTLEPADAR